MNEKIIGKYRYISGWSSELDLNLISAYVDVYKIVFNIDFSIEEFKDKFIKNIYGPSVHVFVYDENVLIAIRSLWRNDLGKTIAYQPCDTAVLDNYRGGGIFKIMTEIALEYVGNSAIYNFPNDTSRKLYLKNGWIVHRTLYKNFFSKNSFERYCPDESIPDKYVKWYFQNKRSLYVTKKAGYYFLLVSRGMGMYVIIGKISHKIYDSNLFKKVYFPILFFRSNNASKIKKINHPTFIVTKGFYDGFIPSWKVDAV